MSSEAKSVTNSPPEPKQLKMDVPNVKAPEGREILVIIPFAWGLGPDLRTAYEQAKREGDPKHCPMLYAAAVYPETTEVTELGGIRFQRDKPPAVIFSTRPVENLEAQDRRRNQPAANNPQRRSSDTASRM